MLMLAPLDHILSTLWIFFTTADFDVLAVTETWLVSGDDDDVISIAGYRIVRRDGTGRGAGICVYLRSGIKYSLLDVEHADSFEQLWLKITVGAQTVTLGVVYRSPSKSESAFVKDFELTLSGLVPSMENLVLTGDFNIDFLRPSNTYTRRLSDLFECFNLSQIIVSPTRVTDATSTLIDLMVVSRPGDVLDSSVLDLGGITDHFLVFCTVSGVRRRMPPQVFRFRNYKNINYDSFQTDLQNMNWAGVFDIDSIDEKVQYFNNVILALFDFYAPIAECSGRRHHLPWVTPTIREMIKKKNKAFSRYKATGRQQQWDYYKELRNVTTTAIRNEKKAYFEYVCRGSSTRGMWKKLKRFGILPSKQNVIPEHLSDANKINVHFSNAVSNVRVDADDALIKFYTSHRLKQGIQSFAFTLISEDDVLRILTGISSSAVGADGVSADMLRFCCPTILCHLTHIFNYCLTNAIFPKDWKLGLINPIPKTTKCHTLDDLRPITILPVLSKILERFVLDQIRNYLESNNLLPARQSGFRSMHGCSTAMLDVTDDLFRAFDNGDHSVLLLLDFSKAFDILDHRLLLAVLSYVGFSDDCVRFMGSFIGNREQAVRVGVSTSVAIGVGAGVPQGSCISPILYAIYTCNIFSNLKFLKYHLYADDSQLYCSFHRDELDHAVASINDELCDLSENIRRHALILNPNKSQAILFSRRRGIDWEDPRLDFQLLGAKIRVSRTVCSLGLVVDDGLRFEQHANKMIGRAYSALKGLFCSRDILTRPMKKLLCDSVVLSHFNHCDVVYSSCLTSRMKRRIQVVQNSCLRFIHGIRRRDHISHTLKDTGWLSMADRRRLHSS